MQPGSSLCGHGVYGCDLEGPLHGGVKLTRFVINHGVQVIPEVFQRCIAMERAVEGVRTRWEKSASLGL
jgi:hypothetical protein